MLHIYTTNLSRSHIIAQTQPLTTTISLLPPSDYDEAGSDNFLATLPQPPDGCTHLIHPIHDVMYNDLNMSLNHRRKERRLDQKGYTDPEYLPNRKRLMALIRDLHTLADHHRNNTEQHVLIHCRGGVSRSTAVTFTLLAMVCGYDHAESLYQTLLNGHPSACPNPLLLFLFDGILKTNGALLQARQSGRISHNIQNSIGLRIHEQHVTLIR